MYVHVTSTGYAALEVPCVKKPLQKSMFHAFVLGSVFEKNPSILNPFRIEV